MVIRDNGVGIEETIKTKVFSPFFTTKPTAEAAGTGLYLSREVVLNHKGTIAIESEKDKYTLTVAGKEYQASYFGEEDISGWAGDYQSRAFWRLEGASVLCYTQF